MMREALSGLIHASWPDTQVELVSSFEEACASVESRKPDLILSDLGMPGAGPAEGIARLRQAASGVPLIAITAIEEDEILLALLALGVEGFVPKSSSTRLIEAAIQLVLAGGRYLPPRVADLLTAQAKPRHAGTEMLAVARLTERQIEVLHLIASGHSNKEIARELDLSPATVKAHAAVAFGALGAVNRTEAVVKARSIGLI